ncbi:hypothetical protein [Erythrobacter sp. THAF29]|uniref:hypothetical protein n=1 Tax=Erythrobacter sp. THAF29 TaxID=2587851 RepID=UPI0012690CF2|nr:hypothetical protein [Erythrobacter sp. THAF29]QFT78130.1 hypothetical protein FIU90_11325 [Erythrobacter sp. THAF29]
MVESERTGKSRFISGCGGCLTVLASLFVALWIGWEMLRYQNEQARIPANLTVEHKVYGEEKSFGFGGPGDAETGLAVYRLSKRDFDRLTSNSSSLIDDESIRETMGRRPGRHDYAAWHPTPFDPEFVGSPWDRSKYPVGSFDIGEFLWRDGAFGIEVDPIVARKVNRILNEPGAYYAEGRGSVLIIVAPEEAVVVFAYAG